MIVTSKIKLVNSVFDSMAISHLDLIETGTSEELLLISKMML